MAVGQSFQVAIAPGNGQSGGHVTTLGDGRYLITWHDWASDGTQLNIHGQIFNADHSRDGDPFLIGTSHDGAQYEPVATALPGGGFFVAWTTYSEATGLYSDVIGQVFDSTGTALGDEATLNLNTVDNQQGVDLATLTDGSIVAIWDGDSDTGEGSQVLARRFAADGTPLGAEFAVNATSAGNQSDAAVTALSGGGYVVSWTSTGQDGSGQSVHIQRFTTAGQPTGAETRVNITTANNQSRADITALSDGGFVVTWTSTGQDGALDGIYARVFDATGTAQTGEVLINATTPPRDQEDPVIAALSTGGFVVVWKAMGQDGDDWGIIARRFDVDGTAACDEFVVNEHVASFQVDPTVAALENGDFTVTYSGIGPAGASVFARVFSDAVEPDGAVAIGGTVKPGQTVTADTSGLSDVYGMGALSYQWLRNGAAITGATQASYAIGQADAGSELSVAVNWTSDAGYDETATSVAVAIGTESQPEITGGAGDDTLTGSGGADTIMGAGGNDVLKGFRGNDRLLGEGGHDILLGGAGRDTLSGGGGHDTLSGNNGKDRIVGLAGDDRLTGGTGIDRFIFSDNGSDDVITDFEDGIDRIVINGPGMGFDDVTLTQNGDDVVITFGRTSITVLNEMIENLTEADIL